MPTQLSPSLLLYHIEDISGISKQRTQQKSTFAQLKIGSESTQNGEV